METWAWIILAIVAVVLIVGLLGLIFGTWLTVKLVQAIVNGITGLFAGPRRRPPSAETLRCPRPKCHAPNVPSARFCRRCGIGMNARSVAVGPRQGVRAAAW